jgi:hypothetical protein
LWEGADHVFSVTGTRFSERYRRFYYRDIQALVIHRCARPGSIGIWLLTTALCVFFATFFAIFGTSFRAAPAWLRFSLWIGSSFSFLYLVYRLIVSLKYSCRCYIQTAVTWEELPSLYRIWNAQKTLGRVRTRIMETQGALAEDPQTLVKKAMEQESAPQLNSFEWDQVAGREGDKTGGKYSTTTGMNLALSGCITLLVIAAFLFWYMDASVQYANHLGIIAVNALLTLVAGAGFVLSLLSIYKVRALHSLRNFLFAALSLLGIHVYFSSILSRMYPQGDAVSAALSSPAFRHWFSLIDGSFSLLFGIFGVALIAFNWQSYSKGQVSNT